MRKLIEFSQENLIECDNCDFVIPNEDPKNPGNGKEYINIPCPKCGENLLTEKDYTDDLKFMRNLDRINKWFSWITVFPWFRNHKNQNEPVTVVKVHNGIKLKK